MPAAFNNLAPISRVVSATTKFKSNVKQWPNGAISVKRLWSAPLMAFEIEYDALTTTQWNALINHFKTNYGEWGIFEFTDPHTNLNYFVKYTEDNLARVNARKNSRGLYRLKVKLEEVR